MQIWMSNEEIDLIKSNLDPSHIMLEWGSGGSTTEFPKYVKKYYSIEHDPSWFDNVKKETPDNVDYHLIELDKPLTDPTQKTQVQTYLDFVDKLGVEKFDRVLIDGRGRGWCAEKVLPYLKEDSIVFIHDYWQRSQYFIVEKWYDVIDYVQSGQSIVALKPKKEVLDRINKKSTNIKISFIQPSRNNLKYLKWSYNAIRKNQGDHEAEICIADDFSNDGTWEWCQEMMQKDPYFKAIRNEGPTRLGHTILYDKLVNEVATHDICMIYHADMYLCPNALNEISKYIAPKTIVSLTRIEPPLHPDGPEKILADFGIETEEFDEDKFLNWFKNDLKPKHYQPTEGVFAPWAFMKSDFQEIGGHDPLYAPQSKEDSDIFNRFQLNGVKFLQTWEGCVYHMTCRGSRFNPTLTTPGTNSSEWEAQNLRSTRNFIRKWGHFCKHDSLMKPIIPPKYDVGFIVSNCGLPHLEILEPWCSTIYIKDDMQLIVPDYIQKEQSNTKFDLQERIKPYDNEKQNNILVSFDASKLNNQNIQILYQLSEIIKDSGDIGTFELDIFTINIIHMSEYQNSLIIN